MNGADFFAFFSGKSCAIGSAFVSIIGDTCLRVYLRDFNPTRYKSVGSRTFGSSLMSVLVLSVLLSGVFWYFLFFSQECRWHR